MSRTLFSTVSEGRSAEAGAESTGAGAGDRLAEAVEVMARIRANGQWESAQTHASLLPYLVEESWELIDAVADGDRDELVSELGDLLLQVLFHAAIGAERAEESFDIQDVAGALLDKLRRRAPYWFSGEGSTGPGDAPDVAAGPDSAGTKGAGLDAAEQDRLWQEAKAAERTGRPPRGVVDGIPWDMPALALGQKVLARALSAGVPDDLVPEEMLVVRVRPTGLFRERAASAGADTDTDTDAGGNVDGIGIGNAGTGGDDSGSAEVAYRQVVRRFAADVREAESRLPVPTADATPDDWRAAWPTRPA